MGIGIQINLKSDFLISKFNKPDIYGTIHPDLRGLERVLQGYIQVIGHFKERHNTI